MNQDIDKVLSQGDKELLKKFATLDELSESDARICLKKAYADLKNASIAYSRLEEEDNRVIEALNRKVDELRTRIEKRDEKVRKLFDL
jgi:hypothetical protein